MVRPPATADWRRLTGARVLAAADHAEVVIEPSDDPLARKIAQHKLDV